MIVFVKGGQLVQKYVDAYEEGEDCKLYFGVWVILGLEIGGCL